MTDKTNPRARLDAALASMRYTDARAKNTEHITLAATVACAEALSLLVDAHMPEPEPEPDPSRAGKAEAELRARELHHFEAEQSEAKAVVERDNAIAALRAIRRQLALGVILAAPNGDPRKTYRQSLTIVEAEARCHGIDLDEEVS